MRVYIHYVVIATGLKHEFSSNRDKATKTELVINILSAPVCSYHSEHTWKHTKQLARSACSVQTPSLQSHLAEQTSVSQHALSQFSSKNCQRGKNSVINSTGRNNRVRKLHYLQNHSTAEKSLVSHVDMVN